MRQNVTEILVYSSVEILVEYDIVLSRYEHKQLESTVIDVIYGCNVIYDGVVLVLYEYSVIYEKVEVRIYEEMEVHVHAHVDVHDVVLVLIDVGH